jgi:hypothetical protein
MYNGNGATVVVPQGMRRYEAVAGRRWQHLLLAPTITEEHGFCSKILSQSMLYILISMEAYSGG